MATILVGAALAALLFLAARAFVRDARSGSCSACGGQCSHCSHCDRRC